MISCTTWQHNGITAISSAAEILVHNRMKYYFQSVNMVKNGQQYLRPRHAELNKLIKHRLQNTEKSRFLEPSFSVNLLPDNSNQRSFLTPPQSKVVIVPLISLTARFFKSISIIRWVSLGLTRIDRYALRKQ